MLSVDQIGYRSNHYVCDLGPSRTKLPEYSHLTGLKFEIQVRTVLQHAWAELEHDRNYKFAGRLPRPIERQLFLYAGMLEIADKGFDSLSDQIDTYIAEIKEKTEGGDFEIELDSVSLEQFVQSWAKDAGLDLSNPPPRGDSKLLVDELRAFGIQTLNDLKTIIPPSYSVTAQEFGYDTNIFGLLRDWMVMHDYERYRDKAWKQSWYQIEDHVAPNNEREFYTRILGATKTEEIFGVFTRVDDDDLWEEY